MTEIESQVYDIVYPCPATLEEISSIAIALQVWRWELQKYGPNYIMKTLYPKGKSDLNISLPDEISKLPSTIDCMIKKYHKLLIASMYGWLQYNFRFIFQFCRYNHNGILNDFNDIACDFNGTIHYDRTAKRMLQCDRIGLNVKFLIACVYCFEDDIRQIWPLVESEIDLNKIIFDQCPYLHYWVCRIRNEMDKIPNLGNDSVEETMLKFDTRSRSTFEYFWNRISLEKQSEIALKFCQKGTPMGFYSKFIIPKFNDQQVALFVENRDSIQWFYEMLSDEGSREYIWPIWMCIKENINERFFKKLAKRLVWAETHLCTSDASTEEDCCNDEILTLCYKIWNSVADHLKQAAIKYMFNDDGLLDSLSKVLQTRETRFLLVVLLDAPVNESSTFWHSSWFHLLRSTNETDFLKIMKLCLNEEQIHQFKETTMSKYENIEDVIKYYLEKGRYNKLKDFVSLCCPDQKSKRIMNQKILQSGFFSIYEIFDVENVQVLEPAREFIDNVYANDPDLLNDSSFDLSMSLLPDSTEHLKRYSLNEVMKFIDTFASFIRNLDEIKKERFVKSLRRYIMKGPINRFDGEEVRKFLIWCWGKDDENEMIKFKESISPDQVVRYMARNERRVNRVDDPEEDFDKLYYPETLDPFISWYFTTVEEMDEFYFRLVDTGMLYP